MRGAMAALGSLGFHDDLELKPYRMQFGHRETILLAMGLELYTARPSEKYQEHTVGDVLIQTSQQLDAMIEKNQNIKPIADAIRYAGHLEILRAVTAVQLDRKRYAEICTRRIHRIIELLGSRRLLLVVVNDRILSGFACVGLDNGNLRLQITHPHGVQRWEVHMGGVHGGSFERWLQAWYLDPNHPDIPPGGVSLPCDLQPPNNPTELVQGWIAELNLQA